ncbi:MAG: LytR C-terminal domain-containing protein [Weeksellaceae bacterium]
MLYIFLDTNQIKLLHLKKSMLGQYETSFYQKNLQVDLITDKKPNNLDVIASGIKETLDAIPTAPLKEKDVMLVLPQSVFSYLRIDTPADITPPVLDSYVREKARSDLNLELEQCYFSYFTSSSEEKSQLMLYAIPKETVAAFAQPCTLLDLKVVGVIPESLAYFQLFEKTLRTNKKEYIWYLSYANNKLQGYVYDSFGLLEETRWEHSVVEGEKIEAVLQKQAAEYETKGMKLNRLILSGAQSDGIRQDTFTKDVGVWTNPLKRIIPHFYQEYLKMLGDQEQKPLPILDYDMLIGGFIFNLEHKDFTLMKESKGMSKLSAPNMSMPSMEGKHIPWKGMLFFLLSFAVTVGLLFGLSRVPWRTLAKSGPSLPFMNQASPTPEASPTPAAPSPTPTPEVDRATVRVKILNGSGISGKASEVKEVLQEQGYEDILTGNADAFDYETTVIQVKEDSKKLQDIMTKDIVANVPAPEFEALDEEDAADIVIIVGTDFK